MIKSYRSSAFFRISLSSLPIGEMTKQVFVFVAIIDIYWVAFEFSINGLVGQSKRSRKKNI
jgi:hypothetical protein